MIAFLRGILIAKDLDRVVIDVAGVGYEVGVSHTTLASLPPVGEKTQLLIHMVVREDALTLYGFATAEERRMFEKLTTITGVGPKLGLTILSSFDVPTLISIVRSDDEDRMTTVPYVGKKTARRLLLELSSIIEKDEVFSTISVSGQPGALADSAAVDDEAVSALLAMGFTEAEAELALVGYDGARNDTAAAIRYALRKLGDG